MTRRSCEYLRNRRATSVCPQFGAGAEHIKMIKSILAASAVLVMACATVGHDFDATKAKNLKPGESTIDDAVALMGSPRSTTTLGNGDTMCMWMYSSASVVPLPFYTAMNSKSKTVMLTFGRDGKLKPGFGYPSAVGKDFDPSLVSVLKPGVATLEDARRLFGEPAYTSTQAGGKLLCVWSHSSINSTAPNGQTQVSSKSVTLAFGPDGKLLDSSYPVAPPTPKADLVPAGEAK